MPKKVLVSKKAVTKKVVKKTTKSTSVNSEAKPLVLASNTESFWVTDGRILNSLMALHQALDSMEKQQFEYHVAKDRNDFAEWVNSVLCDSACAEDLRKAKTAKSARAVVTKHLKSYIT